MTDFLGIIHRLSLIKTHDVSETGVCLRHQVKKDTLLGTMYRASSNLRPEIGTRDRRWIMSRKFVIPTTHHHHKPSEFTYKYWSSMRFVAYDTILLFFNITCSYKIFLPLSRLIYIFVLYLTTLFQQLMLYSFEWKYDKWMMNWKWFINKRLWHNF
jgi:hypothetical protein